MKHLSNRQEIGEAMNFGKYPVLYIDLDNKPDWSASEGLDFATGADVKVAWDRKEIRYKGMTTRGKVYYQDGKFFIDQNCGMLKKDFSRSDVLEDLHWANVPTVHKGQEVVLVIDSSNEKRCGVVIMKVSETIDIHCQTVCRLEELK